jgi:hypothetical protein
VIRVLVAALVLASLPAASRAAPPKVADVPGGIVRLLDDRGKAYSTKDRGLLERTLVPGDFRAAQLAAFDHAVALDFSTFSFRANTQFAGDIATARVRTRYPGRAVSAFQVTEESAIAGIETVPYAEEDFFTFVRDPGDAADPYDGWRTASSTDFEPLGIFSAVHLWDSGAIALARSDHFLLITHPDRIGSVRPAIDQAERSLREAKRFWPRPLDPRYVIVVPSTADELSRMLQSTVDVSKFVAFAAATTKRDEGWEPVGVRVFIQLSHFQTYDDAGKRAVLTHELIHAITRPVSGPFLPTWVEEGLAMFGAEGEDGLSRARRASLPEAFPADEDFFVGATSGIVLTYSRAQAAIASLAKRNADDGVARFYEALGRKRVDPGTKDYQLRRALQESVSWTVEDWTKAWQAHLRG